MEQVIGEGGTLRMKYNFLSSDRQLFRINETFNYEKIIRVDATKNCNCSGLVNTFYVVNGSRIPTSRAIQINT